MKMTESVCCLIVVAALARLPEWKSAELLTE